MNYTFQYLQTINAEFGNRYNQGDELLNARYKIIEFQCSECGNFKYYAVCYDGIIQWIRGLSGYEIDWEATDSEIEAHGLRVEEFQANHMVLQAWIDSL